MQKEKPKRSENPNHLEFVSPLPLSTCISLISELGTTYSISERATNTSVKHEFLSQESATFSVKKGYVILRGHLTTQDASSTWVVCDREMSWAWKIAYIPLMAASIIGSVAIITEVSFRLGLVVMIGMGMILLMMSYEAYRARIELFNKVRQALDYGEEKVKRS